MPLFPPTPREIKAEGLDLLYVEGFFGESEAEALFRRLLERTPWRQDEITVYGRSVPIPRKEAWYGDPGASYTYSGLKLDPLPWTETLAGIKTRVEAEAGARFNSCLLNLYRNGADSVGWHADDEPELGPAPLIASVSFGAVRRFSLKANDRSETRQIDLAPGSLLLMRPPTQRFWKHQLAKTRKPVGPRVNLTFRLVSEKSFS